ncbi:MAG: extracellular solute-binding protein, partial [Leptotrichia sp.]|nr:extracellular solute-binding protein [Leptotrichia sp.]
SWDDIKSKVSIAAAGKKAAADIIEVDWSWIGEFQSAGWLEPLEINEDTQKDILSLDYFKVDGKYYAMPHFNDLRVAYINKEMLKKAGVETLPSKWSELESVMDQLQAKGVIKNPMLYPLGAEENATTSFITLVYTRSGEVFNKDNTLNKANALEALQMIKKYLDKGYINPETISADGGTVYKGIINGNGAFLIGPTFYITSANDPKESKVVGQISTLPIPSVEGAATKTVAFTEAMGISAYSENKEAAKKFIEWVSRPEVQFKLSKAINLTPTRTSVIQKMTDEGTIPGGPGSLIEQAKIVGSPFPNGVPKYYTKMSTEIFNIINQMAQGKLTPEQAADQMEQKVNELAKANS